MPFITNWSICFWSRQPLGRSFLALKSQKTPSNEKKRRRVQIWTLRLRLRISYATTLNTNVKLMILFFWIGNADYMIIPCPLCSQKCQIKFFFIYFLPGISKPYTSFGLSITVSHFICSRLQAVLHHLSVHHLALPHKQIHDILGWCQADMEGHFYHLFTVRVPFHHTCFHWHGTYCYRYQNQCSSTTISSKRHSLI